ncbi:MAG TPA: hypothetical protein VMS04_11095 [Vicinamibacterales bacterium]|jgi:hypothetical protein|nr:hypothetical protein [Vicinamibacterales bacterium]
MNKAAFRASLAELQLELTKLTASKGEDYSNSDDQLANFKRLAERLGTTPETIALVHLSKHLDAIDSYVRRRADATYRPSEPIRGRILDAILYLWLLECLRAEREPAAH